jgi:serine/threonine protein kinase/predicted Zn-dependent protease
MSSHSTPNDARKQPSVDELPTVEGQDLEPPSVLPDDIPPLPHDEAPTAPPADGVFPSTEGGSPPPEFSIPSPPALAAQVPGYEILGELGRGGMGVVYRARQVGLGRIVALKMILAGGHAGQAAMARFQTEAQAIARLHHPNIVQVYEIGEHDGLPFFSLEFCDAGSLDKKLARNPLPPEQAVELAEVLAQAMYAAHQANVIHRDLKPGNVLLAYPSPQPPPRSGEGEKDRRQPLGATSTAAGSTLSASGRGVGGEGLRDAIPKITDFGLAKKLDETGHTHTGEVLGTPSYMAPEQAEGKRDIGPSADLYALGAILYEMLTGRPPFQAATVFDTITQVVAADPVPPRQLNAQVPRDLETVCLKCLRKEPRQRYADCRELAGDLRRWLDGEPIHARPIGVIERSFKWARRKPFQAAFALSSLFLVALLFFAFWQQARDYRLKYERRLRTEVYRGEREKDFLDARQLMAEGKWADARSRLVGIQKGLEALRDLPADDLQDRVRQSLDDVDRHLQVDRERELALARWQAFQKPYRDAVFRQVPLTGHHLPESRSQTRASVQQALAIYALDAETIPPGSLTDRLEHDRPLLPAADFARLTAACYELLLIWAEVEATDTHDRNEPNAQARQRGQRALVLLERVGLLGRAYKLQSQTYFIRKARYRALGRDDKEPSPALDPDAPREPTCALDWFFRGLESYHKAEQLEETGQADRYLEASKSLAQAVAAQVDHFWAHYLQGLCQLRLGRWREARAALTVCMNLQRDFPWPLVLRGFAASEQGAWLAAQEAELRKKAIQQGGLPEQSAAIRRLSREKEFEFTLARADLDQALAQKQLDSQARYVGLVNRGVLFIRREKWPRAITDLKEAIGVNGSAYQAHVNLAQALQGAGRGKEALTAISRAIDCAPARPELYVVRARMHLDQRNRLSARPDFERAVAREPPASKSRRLGETLVELGRLLLEEERFSDALVHFERALKVRPELILTERFKAEALLHLKRNDEAAAALDRYLAATPVPVAEALQARGLLHAGKGQLRAAIDLFGAALRLNTRDTKTRGYRAWTYIAIGANRLALDDFEVCLREQPGSADYLTGRAGARARLRQVPEAIADAQAAEKAGPLTDRLCYHLSCVYSQAVAQQGLETGAERNRKTEQAIARHEEKALLFLSRALEEQPEKDRSRFWRERVEKDPALAAIRSGRQYSQLARKYGLDRRSR